jgi:hypothetical protein
MSKSQIKEFIRKRDPQAHDHFQSWRHRNTNGFILNCITRSSGLLHRVNCNRHLGDTKWKAGYEGDLTKKLKVCARSLPKLETWAGRAGFHIEKCQHCKPVENEKLNHHTASDAPERTTAFQFKAGFKPRAVTGTAAMSGESYEVTHRHQKIQEALYRRLVTLYGSSNVGTENDGVDVVVRRRFQYWFYEIKAADTPRACIREALSQLLEYSYWPPKVEKVEKLIIVGEPSLDQDAAEYLALLRARFSLLIEYQQFDMRKRALVNCP